MHQTTLGTDEILSFISSLMNSLTKVKAAKNEEGATKIQGMLDKVQGILTPDTDLFIITSYTLEELQAEGRKLPVNRLGLSEKASEAIPLSVGGTYIHTAGNLADEVTEKLLHYQGASDEIVKEIQEKLKPYYLTMLAF